MTIYYQFIILSFFQFKKRKNFGHTDKFSQYNMVFKQIYNYLTQKNVRSDLYYVIIVSVIFYIESAQNFSLETLLKKRISYFERLITF